MVKNLENGKFVAKNLQDLEEEHGVSFSRYNGGWVKRVTGIDKSKTNGYSILGEFVNFPLIYEPGEVYLDCSIDGSRKHHKFYYSVYLVDQEGKWIEIGHYNAGYDKSGWAVEIWDVLENALLESKKISGIEQEPNPLEKFSDDEILKEAARRGLI